MNYLKLITLMILANSCCIQNNARNKVIVYIFPKSVDSFLVSKIKGNDKNIYFFLSKVSDEYSLSLSDNKKGNKLARKSNRNVFLEGNLYPLLFDYDHAFATYENANQIKKKYLIDKYFLYGKTFTIYHGYFIKFRATGEIIATGIDKAQKVNYH